jgi:hypothetical protein
MAKRAYKKNEKQCNFEFVKGEQRAITKRIRMFLRNKVKFGEGDYLHLRMPVVGHALQYEGYGKVFKVNFL